MERSLLLLSVLSALLSWDFVTGCLLCHGSARALLPAPTGAFGTSQEAVPPSSGHGWDRTTPRQPLFAAENGGVYAITNHRIRNNLHSKEEEKGTTDEKEQKKVPETEPDYDDGMSTAMIASIGFYKKVISPLLPPACRFVPTCSSYGVQAIEEFGPGKGGILIAWRLLRCSPIGGKGYDPPKWPPVPFTYSSY